MADRSFFVSEEERGAASEEYEGTRGAVEIVDVGMVFKRGDHEVEVLDGISIDVPDGKFVSVLGPSGCGKSTLLRLVAGLVEPTSGKIYVHGHRVRKPPPSLGMVFQDDTLVEWRTVLKNVLLPAEIKKLSMEAAKRRALELLAQVDLTEFQHARPSELSGGMKQRASLCQALVHNPRLLLMDEPFGALDALTREQMQSDLQALLAVEKCTVLFVTHSISEAVLLSDRVVVLSQRPARILVTLDIQLPRPRTEATKSTPTFLKLAAEIHELFRREGVLH